MRISTRLSLFGMLLAMLGALWGGSSAIGAPRSPQAPQAGEFDHGDAPDSTNHFGVAMQAYAGVPAEYPTVYDLTTGYPPGPSHIDPNAMFLGTSVTVEEETDIGADSDGVNNIDPSGNQADLDRGENAFPSGPPAMADFTNCTPTKLQVVVTVNTMVSDIAFLNLWFDWDRSGKWGDVRDCSAGPSEEWAVQNQVLTLTGPGVYTFTTLTFIPSIPSTGARPVWMRVSLSEEPASNRDGRGPDNRWRYGETEDYLLKGDPTDPSPTPTPPVSDIVADLGDAPDSTNSFGSGMLAYIGVPARFPTVFSAGGPPPGPRHNDARLFHLGQNVTFENEADIGFDADGINNLVPLPAPGTPDRDRADDGLISPTDLSGFTHCQPTLVTYSVFYNGLASQQVYFNLWADWRRNGAWGDILQCPAGLAEEWAVQNQVIVLTPGLNTFTTPQFLPFNPAGSLNEMWMRLTVSDQPASSNDGSGPSTGWKYGETEDYLLTGDVVDPTKTPTPTPTVIQDDRSDLGDAPDSTNSFGSGMLAYTGVPARFPTVFGAGGPPPGPLHINAKEFHLGQNVTFENEADIGPDADGVNNLVPLPAPGTPNLDKADDGLVSPTDPSGFLFCQPTQITYTVMNNTGLNRTVHFNAWADWTHNGNWGETTQCSNGPVDEWIVQNQVIVLAPGLNTFTTPSFLPWYPSGSNLREFWLRMTVTEPPVPSSSRDGSGPATGWKYGETEDYLLTGDVIDPTKTPTPTPTVIQDDRSDLGDAPDSTNSFGSGMLAYTGVPARFPTVFGAGGPPPGPLHVNAKEFHLGQNVTFENEADIGPDADGVNNLVPLPAPGTPNLDKADDGLVSPTDPSGFLFCQPTQITYTVMNNTGLRTVHFNAWADWTHNGNWGETTQCPDGPVDEWIVQNQVIVLAPGLNTFTTPVFLPWYPSTTNVREFWLRMTVTEPPVPSSSRDGSGPATGWKYGETEDYLIKGDVVDPTATPTPTPTVIQEPTNTPTPTPTNTPTAVPEERFDLGDAPDSTNSFGVGMLAYAGVPARYPTVYGAGGGPPGPLHRNITRFFLGATVTGEVEADTGPDTDTFNNIEPLPGRNNQDKADDGLLRPTALTDMKHCQPTQIVYTVNNTGGLTTVYFNAWQDWNRNGAWGDIMQCPNGLADEWAVQNQAIVLNPGLNTITSPQFLPWHPKDRAALWLRLTVSDVPAPATSRDGSGPASGWKYGETEDYLFAPDLGDAPDSHNSVMLGLLSYGAGSPAAEFPTVYNRLPAGLPYGPVHRNRNLIYTLGKGLTSEWDADTGPEEDPRHNLELTGAPAMVNQDRLDNTFTSVPASNSFAHCQPQTLTYNVEVPNNLVNGTAQAYVNVWFDWTRSGAWGDIKKCGWLGLSVPSREWAVQNQVVTLTGPGVYTFTTPSFFPYQLDPNQPVWMRISISDTPATAADGSGPAGGWAYGETEDFLLRSLIIINPVDDSNEPITGTATVNGKPERQLPVK